MITAYKEGTRKLIFPTRGIRGICPYCEKTLVAKCGSIKAHHFAHKPDSNCDSNKYHDGISEWHIKWQYTINNPLPGINVEVPILDGDYNKRADLVTASGLIVEFQKSPLPIEERILREIHYKNMIWVIHPEIRSSKTWSLNSNIPVFFDVGKFVDYPIVDVEKDEDGEECGWTCWSLLIKRDKFIHSIINGPRFEIEPLDKLHIRLKKLHARSESKPRDIRECYQNKSREPFFRFLDYNWYERKARLSEANQHRLPALNFQFYRCPKCNRIVQYSLDSVEKHMKKCPK